MTELKWFNLLNKDEKLLFDNLFSAYLKEVCDIDEYREEIADLQNEELARRMIESTLQKRNPYFVMKILYGGKCVGLISYTYKETRRTGFINNFYVRPEYRNSGIGTSALSSAEKHIKTSGGSIVELNPVKSSRNFYVRNGYAYARTDLDGEQIYSKILN